MTEWELLEVAEDIEPGDTLIVERDGTEHKMVFSKVDSGYVYLIDADRKTHKFRSSSMEQVGGSGFILRKSEEPLSLK